MATRSEWATRVRRWRASGLTAREFAGREGYNPRTLSWWACALKAEAPARPKFIDVTQLVTASPTTLEIVVRETVVIRARPGFDAALLRDVVAALEAR